MSVENSGARFFISALRERTQQRFFQSAGNFAARARERFRKMFLCREIAREIFAFAMHEHGSNSRKIIVAGKIFGGASGKIISC